MRRRNKDKQWLIFTRGILDKLMSFVVAARSTYTAATRHLVADVAALNIRRQDMVKLGTAFNRTVLIPPETARCPKCGPNPEFIVIDAQAIGCTDPDEVQPLRPGEDCPVLPIEASKLCILQLPALRVAVDKILSGCKPLTESQERHLRAWHHQTVSCRRPSAEAAAAFVFFRFFPLGGEAPTTPAKVERKSVGGGSGVQIDGDVTAGAGSDADAVDKEGSEPARKRARSKLGLGPYAAVRQDDDGNLVLGGKGKVPTPAVETWRDRVGMCAPNFSTYARSDDGAWLCILPFLKAMLAETATSMFQSHNEAAVGLLADSLMFQGKERWRDVTKAADGVGFVSSFLGLFDDEMDAQALFRVSVGVLLRQALDVETIVDDEFAKHAGSKRTLERGWRNAEYCSKWGKQPTTADFAAWKASHPKYRHADVDDPLVSYEFFASLPRVRPGVHDSVAAERRRAYHGKKRHAADVEGDGDACNKAFSIATGLTQGVFNVVCPHVITLGFRCLFRAESVGEALSIVLERFPKLPRVIFYDVACKIDKNAMRRVRPLLRDHDVRCLLDRPHSITHGCSPVYMPDESLGTTAGVATQAAEVSHSISVGNRTSLAYMAPSTYMVHRMIQVAFMNVRKLYRLYSNNVRSENDHIALAPFFHRRLSHSCQRGVACSCYGSSVASGKIAAGMALSGDNGMAKGSVAMGSETITDGTMDSRLRGVSIGVQGSVAVPAPGSPAVPLMSAPFVVSVPSADDPAVQLASPSCSGAAPKAGPDDDGLPAAHDPAELPPFPARGDAASEGGLGDDGLDDDWVLLDGNGPLPSAAGAASAPPAFDSTLFQDVDDAGTHPLSAKMRLAVARLSSGGAGDRPVRPLNHGRILLSEADFLLLEGENWLNDEVMNSYLALVNKRDRALRLARGSAKSAATAAASISRRTFCFNTFLFGRMYSQLRGYDGDGVRNWGIKLGLDMSDVDLIVVPINLSRVHWVVVVVDVEHQTFMYFDPYGTVDDQGCVPIVRQWLYDEAVRQLGLDGARALDVSAWRIVEGNVDWPEQMDASSCGVFSLLFVNCLAAGVAPSFTQSDIPAVRSRMAVDLYLDELSCSSMPAPTL